MRLHRLALIRRLASWYLVIYLFSPPVKYLSCRANTVADVLSRNIPVVAVSQIPNKSLAEVQTAQLHDALWTKVIYTLQSGDDSTLPQLQVPLSAFFLQDGILCRKVATANKDASQVVIPAALVDSSPASS